MNYPIAETALPSRVTCGDYSLSIFDNNGPVIIQGKTCGPQVFTGGIAETIAGHVYAGNLGEAEAYIDNLVKKIWKVMKGWRNGNDL